MARRIASVLTVDDIAKMRGVSRKRAWRWLRRIDAEAGGGVLLRNGRHIYTTLSRLRSVDSRWFEDTAVLRDDVAELRERNYELQRRTAAQARELAAVKSRVNELQIVVERLAEWIESSLRAGGI